VLNRDPKRRPNIEQLKSDPFFEEIDWHALAQRKLDPPKKLEKLPKKESDSSN
jgi:hypothetical protein